MFWTHTVYATSCLVECTETYDFSSTTVILAGIATFLSVLFIFYAGKNLFKEQLSFRSASLFVISTFVLLLPQFFFSAGTMSGCHCYRGPNAEFLTKFWNLTIELFSLLLIASLLLLASSVCKGLWFAFSKKKKKG
jgi:hypothetical protein